MGLDNNDGSWQGRTIGCDGDLPKGLPAGTSSFQRRGPESFARPFDEQHTPQRNLIIVVGIKKAKLSDERYPVPF
jgi:hypothetical protein